MNDRLGELGAFGGYDSEEKESCSHEEESNEEVKVDEEEGAGEDMEVLEDEDFGAKAVSGIHESAAEITRLCETLERNVDLLAKIFNKNLTDGLAQVEKDPKMDILQRETNQLAGQIRGTLKQLKADNAKIEEDETVSSVEKRMRSNVLGTLTQRFVTLMQRYQQLQTNYRNGHREHMVREVRGLRPSATDDEVEQMIDTGDGLAQLMKTDLIDGDRQRDKATLVCFFIYLFYLFYILYLLFIYYYLFIFYLYFIFYILLFYYFIIYLYCLLTGVV